MRLVRVKGGIVEEKNLKTGTGTFDVLENLSLEQQKGMAFLQKRCREKLKMRKNIR